MLLPFLPLSPTTPPQYLRHTVSTHSSPEFSSLPPTSCRVWSGQGWGGALILSAKALEEDEYYVEVAVNFGDEDDDDIVVVGSSSSSHFFFSTKGNKTNTKKKKGERSAFKEKRESGSFKREVRLNYRLQIVSS